jgi:type IV secretory pathway TraG/TraD family ATPase VirD4
LANVGVKVALSLSEKADRDYFTELVGKRGVMTRSTSSQKSASNSSSTTSASERADDLIHPWEWLNFSPDIDGAIVVKSKETGVKNRNGVFRMPLVDATKTPAKQYFDLGSRKHEKEKRIAYQAILKEKASKEDINDVDVWHIDFDSFMSEERTKEAIEEDEFSAWDMER